MVKNEWHGFRTPIDQGPPEGGGAGWFASRLGIAMATSGTPAGLGAGAAGSAAGITSVEDIFENPELLRSVQTPEALSGDVISEAEGNGFRVEKLGKGTHAGQGWVLREYNADGNTTGRIIQWHPGGGHHGALPYWKVSSGAGGTTRIFLTGNPGAE
jgi:hypothetical protein